MRIRSKCDWYKYGEKSSKFFLILKNLELHKAQFEILQKIEKSLPCHKRINLKLFDFYKSLFPENLNVSKNEIMPFLNLVSIPQLTKDQSRDREFILSEKDLRVRRTINRPVTTVLQKNSMRFSWRILKPVLYQVLNQ